MRYLRYFDAVAYKFSSPMNYFDLPNDKMKLVTKLLETTAVITI